MSVKKGMTRYPEEGLIRPLTAHGAVGAIESARRLRPAVYLAAALSVVAALIHLWAMPEHMREWWGYGALFLGVAAAQGLYGVALLRWPSQRLFLPGIGGNLAIVLLYVVTRTAGIPFFGPHAGEVEEVGLLDMSATVAELGLVMVLVASLGGRSRELVISALLLLGAAIWALRLAGILS